MGVAAVIRGALRSVPAAQRSEELDREVLAFDQELRDFVGGAALHRTLDLPAAVALARRLYGTPGYELVGISVVGALAGLIGLPLPPVLSQEPDSKPLAARRDPIGPGGWRGAGE
jgi:hypothetical protein